MSEIQLATIHVHCFKGCRPVPLSNYLKALGIFRQISLFADDSARAWWSQDEFYISSRLDRSALENFFLDDYAPTPMLSPWNGGSGFYPNDKGAREGGVDPIADSLAPRFKELREAISSARKLTNHLEKKPEPGAEKNHLIASCRRLWRGPILKWLNTAIALGTDGDPSFPALLGTGGNDGRLDFTANYLKRLVSLFDVEHDAGVAHADTANLLRAAFWGIPTHLLEDCAVGQFIPGSAGGPNGGDTFSGSSKANSWDYILLLEGTLLFAAGVTRRLEANSLPQAAAPFAVRSSAAGYASADSSDENPRGEQWMPLWGAPTILGELKNLFVEGRSKIETGPVNRGGDMVRAVARMGVARGISSFQRYGFVERNGLSNLAVPLGTFHVAVGKYSELLDELHQAPHGWFDNFRRVADHKNAPASITRAYRAVQQAEFEAARTVSTAAYANLLIALGAAEDQLVQSPKFAAEQRARPLPKLSINWPEAANENGPEWRLAKALAFQAQFDPERNRWVNSIRNHWLPLDDFEAGFKTGEGGLQFSPEQAAVGLDLERALLTVLKRRFIAQQKTKYFPLQLRNPYHGARLADIMAFIEGRTDDARILALARGLMSVRVRSPKSAKPVSIQGAWLQGEALYGIARLAVSTGPLTCHFEPKKGERCTIELPMVRSGAAMFNRLQAGDLAGGIAVASQNLRAAGLAPRFQLAMGSERLAKRLAASLAFGLGQHGLARLAFGLTRQELPPSESEMTPVTTHETNP